MFFEIELTPKPSQLLMILVSTLHLFTGLAISLAEVSVMTKIFSFLFILGSAYYHWAILSGNHKTSILACSYKQDSWTITERSGKKYEATLLKNRLVSRYGIILNFKLKLSDHKHRHRALILLCPDSIPADHFRQLSAILLIR